MVKKTQADIEKMRCQYMDEKKDRYYLIKERAVPDVLLKVIEAKRVLDSGKTDSILDAAEAVGISRSSFYKYKDDIMPFHDAGRGKTINVMLSMDDEPGLLSNVLNKIAKAKANILTIHQSIPIGGIASITLGIEILPDSMELAKLIGDIENLNGVHYLKILGRE